MSFVSDFAVGPTQNFEETSSDATYRLYLLAGQVARRQFSEFHEPLMRLSAFARLILQGSDQDAKDFCLTK